jgi:hypothetical protein
MAAIAYQSPAETAATVAHLMHDYYTMKWTYLYNVCAISVRCRKELEQLATHFIPDKAEQEVSARFQAIFNDTKQDYSQQRGFLDDVISTLLVVDIGCWRTDSQRLWEYNTELRLQTMKLLTLQNSGRDGLEVEVEQEVRTCLIDKYAYIILLLQRRLHCAQNG